MPAITGGAGAGAAWDDGAIDGAGGVGAVGDAGVEAADALGDEEALDSMLLAARPRSTGFNASLLAGLRTPEEEAAAAAPPTNRPPGWSIDAEYAYQDALRWDGSGKLFERFDPLGDVGAIDAKFERALDSMDEGGRLTGDEWQLVMQRLADQPWRGNKSHLDKLVKGLETNRGTCDRLLLQANRTVGTSYPSFQDRVHTFKKQGMSPRKAEREAERAVKADTDALVSQLESKSPLTPTSAPTARTVDPNAIEAGLTAVMAALPSGAGAGDFDALDDALDSLETLWSRTDRRPAELDAIFARLGTSGGQLAARSIEAYIIEKSALDQNPVLAGDPALEQLKKDVTAAVDGSPYQLDKALGDAVERFSQTHKLDSFGPDEFNPFGAASAILALTGYPSSHPLHGDLSRTIANAWR